MNGRLKPKCLATTTLSESWPKPVFAFKGSVGHLPVEAQPYVFSSRWDAKTGNHRVVPEMLYPIQANRQPVLRHEVLEDEYRAYHSVLVNDLALRRKYAPTGKPTKDGTGQAVEPKSVVDLNSVLRSGRIQEIREDLPYLLAYNPSITGPPGYMYTRYKYERQSGRLSAGSISRAPIKSFKPGTVLVPRIVSIRAPFQNVVNMSPLPFTQPISPFDATLIWSAPRNLEVRIFNQPDAVSSLAVKADFGTALSTRARPNKKMEDKDGPKKLTT